MMKKHALDDDLNSSRNVVTGNNVDYLSYKFDEMDLAASWRVLTKQKLTIVNGLRLENASWRTWAKQRNNLKTVSPDTLNWLKDSDVTWLYGPLHTVIKNMDEKDRYAKPKLSTTEETLGLMTLSPKQPELPAVIPQKPLKSALKKVTMSDLLKRSVSELQINTEEANSDSISETNEELGEFSPSVIASHRQPKLRFNQYVEQCVVVPPTKSRLRFSNANEPSSDDDDDYEPESDSDSVIVMRRPSRIRSIKKIEPALLKTNSRSDYDDESSDDSEIIPSSSYRHHHHHHQKKVDEENWEAESAESDAFVQHIIEASKAKQHRRQDPAVSISDGRQQEEQYPGKSDYEYSFDDDDWDTHSEHVEDDPFSFTAHQEYAPIAPEAPVGCQIPDGSSNSNSLFNSIAHWASSHLWPTDNVHN